MKDYTVYYAIKKNCHGYLRQDTVKASSQREACRIVREKVLRDTGRTAFYATCQRPEVTARGLEWRGCTYTRYYAPFKTLW